MRKTLEQFIEEARKIHGDKYDYSKVNYTRCDHKVCIICPEHGEFWQTPHSHLYGHGCKKCFGTKQKKRLTDTKEQFVSKAKLIHGDEYDYSEVNYINNRTPVIIKCKRHGIFEQTPQIHLNGGICPLCKIERLPKLTKSTEQFIIEAQSIHGNKYDYSLVKYVNNKTKVDIICPVHGNFKQTPAAHLIGTGCPKCAYELRRLSLMDFIKKARIVHNNKYDYLKVVQFKNVQEKVEIICPLHGSFFQDPANHLAGHGCPKCAKRNSQLNFYNRLLLDLNIPLIFDKRLEWLGIQSLDIYSERYNFAIEYNGIQHYEPLEFFGGQKAFIYRNFLDAKKEFLCAKNECKLFVVKYDYTEDDYQKLLTEIRELIYERNSNSQVSLGETKNNSRIYFWRGRIGHVDGCLARVRSGKRRVSRPMFAPLFHSR